MYNFFTALISTSNDYTQAVAPIVQLIKSLTGPVLAIVGAVGTLYCILLGVKFAKAEEPQDREKAKGHLKNAIIGFILIFVLLVALSQLTPLMIDWVNNSTAGAATPIPNKG